MFLLICIFMMWLMIFGVACFYFGILRKELRPQIISQFTLALLVTMVVWLLGGYFFAFEGRFQTILTIKNLSLDRALSILFQLCFCLYAVVMLIGSIIDRVKTSRLLLAVMVWVLLVYCPLAYLIWNPAGFLFANGVMDFSGGMVVHLSAGVSTYVFAYCLGDSPHLHDQIEIAWLYLGMIFVTLGWFGFNAGPVGSLNDQAGQVLINTLLVIVTGGGVWSLTSYFVDREESTATLLNGMIVGLVISTAGVGYLSPLKMVLLTAIASCITYLLTEYIRRVYPITDVVDSFGMNGIGGFLGSLGLIFFQPSIIRIQLAALLITLALSCSISMMIGKYILKKSHIDCEKR